jgi:hypothetical protein
MVGGGFAAFSLAPHALVITPAKEVVHVEVNDGTAARQARLSPFAARGKQRKERLCLTCGVAD